MKPFKNCATVALFEPSPGMYLNYGTSSNEVETKIAPFNERATGQRSACIW